MRVYTFYFYADGSSTSSTGFTPGGSFQFESRMPPPIPNTRALQWWQVLGIEADADKATVRKAYRERALKHHPDRGGDAGKMVCINQAYTVAKQLGRA